MPDPYLIAHVVRGSPAFDIAIRMCEGEAKCQPSCGLYPGCKSEPMWIIPTSGHRAYPYWWTAISLLSLRDEEAGNILCLANYPAPIDHPDHYSTSAAPRGQGLIKNLAERLGFVPKPPTITRR